MKQGDRTGLTLVEVLIAMIAFAVGALALAASSASMVRQLAANAQRFRSHSLAESRNEAMNASRCVTASGADRLPGIVAEWTAGAGGSRMTLDQTVKRSDWRGVHVDVFRSGVPCD